MDEIINDNNADGDGTEDNNIKIAFTVTTTLSGSKINTTLVEINQIPSAGDAGGQSDP